MTQHDKQENQERDSVTPARPPAVIALVALCVLAAVVSTGSLLTRFFLIPWPIWAAAPAGFLLAFVFVGTGLLMLGKSATHLVAGCVAIMIAVALLWPLPARIAAQKRRHLQMELPRLHRPPHGAKYSTA
jgi:hypothetical protein